MKLYLTAKSERASKSQGGNKFIECEIQNEKQEIIAKILIEPSKNFENPVTIRIDYDRYKVEEIKRIPWEWGNNIKGEKQ